MKRIILTILFSLCAPFAVAQVGQFETAADIGNPKVKGSTAVLLR
ncbi:MAG: hypothetical protein O2960_15265 [Verrucomicrobia bacterium]|nr:hypothetical protein [Verrucomicrobiota bacterium]